MKAFRELISDSGKTILIVLLLVLGILAFNMGKSWFNRVTAKASDTMDNAIESNITQYDRTDIPGSEVINCISSFMDSSDEIYVEVKNGTTDIVYIYPSKQVTSDEKQSHAELSAALKLAKQKGNSEYISPRSKYTGTVQYHPDDDTVIVGLLFERQ